MESIPILILITRVDIDLFMFGFRFSKHKRKYGQIFLFNVIRAWHINLQWVHIPFRCQDNANTWRYAFL